MIYLDLILNLSLLVALSIVSGFIDKRWPRNTRLGMLLQGTLFGGTALIGAVHCPGHHRAQASPGGIVEEDG